MLCIATPLLEGEDPTSNHITSTTKEKEQRLAHRGFFYFSAVCPTPFYAMLKLCRLWMVYISSCEQGLLLLVY